MADPTLRPARPRFGTDGVRGAANSELTAEYALAFGRAVARVLHPTDVYVGRDPRRSGPMFEGALCAGLVAEGVTVHLLGVCPTPAVAWASATTGRPGVMISASHNPFGDNGLKVFSAGGLKLSDAEQAAFEPVLAELLDGAPPPARPLRCPRWPPCWETRAWSPATPLRWPPPSRAGGSTVAGW
ncbi:MAG: hypothetical protein R2749_24625 [Acidimicrobiales bacterium]